MKRKYTSILIVFFSLMSNLSFSQDLSLKDTSLLHLYILKADSLYHRAEYNNSTNYYEKAATILESVYSISNDQLILAEYLTIRRYIGYNYACTGEYTKAKKFLYETFLIASKRERENDNVMADIYRTLGNTCFAIGDYDTASVYLLKSIETYLYQDTCDELKLASAYNDYGNVLEARDNFYEALKYKYNALHIREMQSGNDRILLKNTICSIANTYQKIGKYDTAQILYFNALNELKKVYGETHPEIGYLLNNIGTNYFYKGDFETAGNYYKTALSIFNLYYNSNHPVFANIFNNIGTEITSTGEYEMAISYFKQSERIYTCNFGPEYLPLADVYNNLGTVYNYLSENELAIDYYLKSVKTRTNALGDLNLDIARTYDNIGSVHCKKGDNISALDYYTKALRIRQSYLPRINKDLAASFNNIGCIYQLLGFIDSSALYYKNALFQYSITVGEKHPDLANCYNNIGSLFKEQNQWEMALYYYQKAIIANSKYFNDSINLLANPLFNNYYSGKELLSSLASKATVLSKLYYITRSIDYSKTALSTFFLCDSLIDDIRYSFLSNNDRITLGKLSSEVYKEAIGLCYKLWENDTLSASSFERAFYFSERNKNATLLLTIEEAGIEKMADIPDSILRVEKSIAIKKTFYENNIKNFSLSKEDIGELNELENNYFKLIREEEELKEYMKYNYPKYYHFKYHSELLTLKDMRSAMDPGKAIIEYYLGGNDLYSYVVTAKDFYIAKISVDTTQMNAIKHYCESIYNDDFEFFIENNHSLYNLFIKPVLYLMDSCVKSIMIIPDDNFYNLPFETLVNSNISVNNINFSKLNYLIRRYEISYYYSLSLFSNRIERNYGLEKNQTNFVGFAPVFNGSSAINGVSLNNLKYAIDEVALIGDLYIERGNRTRLFLGSEASESNFKKNISNYRYIHIATHGYSDDFEPSMSFLAFAQSKIMTNGSLINDSTDENNILHANEMYNLTLSADLIVLSACETGVGKVIKGEGVMTMTRGFIYSGAKNIIHTLWNIDDETTQKLMVNFYSNVLNNKSYSYSLREAKLKLIDSEITAFPHFWAGYILIGQ